MAKFKMVLRRTELSGGKYNLTVRATHCGHVMYMNVGKMTQNQYDLIFTKKSTDPKCIEFRDSCNKYITKCERIFSEMNVYNPKRLRELFYEKDKETPTSLLLKDMFTNFIETYGVEKLKIRTRAHIKMTMQTFENYKSGLSIIDITPDFLQKFERDKLKQGWSQSSIDSNLRDLRRIINYYTNEVKLIPRTYEYPFGKGRGYSLKSFWPKKIVMSNKEIKTIVGLKKFDNPELEYARDIWLLLYRMNGINFGDLLRMRWDNIHGQYIKIIRKKTETTRRNNINEISIPITPKLRELIDKIGVKTSHFILGLLNEGYSDITFENKNHKMRGILNKDLTTLSKKLKLSVPLKLKTARDSYATTLKRGGRSIEEISEMLGHANPQTSSHYLASLDIEKTHKINEILF